MTKSFYILLDVISDCFDYSGDNTCAGWYNSDLCYARSAKVFLHRNQTYPVSATAHSSLLQIPWTLGQGSNQSWLYRHIRKTLGRDYFITSDPQHVTEITGSRVRHQLMRGEKGPAYVFLHGILSNQSLFVSVSLFASALLVCCLNVTNLKAGHHPQQKPFLPRNSKEQMMSLPGLFHFGCLGIVLQHLQFTYALGWPLLPLSPVCHLCLPLLPLKMWAKGSPRCSPRGSLYCEGVTSMYHFTMQSSSLQ